MDYQFFTDITGQAIAECEMDTALFGTWLTHDIATNQTLITQLLEAIEDLLTKKTKQFVQSYGEYQLQLDADEAYLNSRFADVAEDELPEGTELDEHMSCGCGLEDLQHLLLSWQDFIAKL